MVVEKTGNSKGRINGGRGEPPWLEPNMYKLHANVMTNIGKKYKILVNNGKVEGSEHIMMCWNAGFQFDLFSMSFQSFSIDVAEFKYDWYSTIDLR